ncbi:MAG: triphosphoribosyl-dephospho-CoA synthase [Mariniblastus sp.]
MSELFLTPGAIANLACSLEVTAPKPGNVHRGADFEDVTFSDFVTSAILLGQTIDQFHNKPVGETVLQSVLQTKTVVGTNTNLGIVLLIVPLSKIVAAEPSIELTSIKVAEFLNSLDSNDANEIFEAIRVANPGGLGNTQELDVNQTVSEDKEFDLLSAMKLAEDRDDIARQFTTGYQDVFEMGIPLLLTGIQLFGNLIHAIVFLHVSLMSRRCDTLILRKCGAKTAKQSQILASKVIDELGEIVVGSVALLAEDQVESYWSHVSELDFWLRSDGHRRNPGTTADLVAATLFVAIQNRIIRPPFK